MVAFHFKSQALNVPCEREKRAADLGSFREVCGKI